MLTSSTPSDFEFQTKPLGTFCLCIGHLSSRSSPGIAAAFLPQAIRHSLPFRQKIKGHCSQLVTFLDPSSAMSTEKVAEDVGAPRLKQEGRIDPGAGHDPSAATHEAGNASLKADDKTSPRDVHGIRVSSPTLAGSRKRKPTDSRSGSWSSSQYCRASSSTPLTTLLSPT